MKKKLRVLIADDEALGRKEMRRLLKAHPKVRIVAEAEDGDMAVAMIEKHKPDLIFLDIRMPGLDGFAVLDALKPPLPEVVFCTAYDQFAVHAVRRGALDYLLKPIAPKELAEALERAERKMDSLPKTVGSPRTKKFGKMDRVFLRDGKKSLFVEVGKILLFESQGNYTNVISHDSHILLHKPLAYFEEKIDPQLFLRANRSQLINLEKVCQWDSMDGGRFRVHLEGGSTSVISRRKVRIFQERRGL